MYISCAYTFVQCGGSPEASDAADIDALEHDEPWQLCTDEAGLSKRQDKQEVGGAIN